MSSTLVLAEPPQTKQPEVLEEDRPTLLIVDDEEGPRHSLRVVFKEEYQLLEAESGPEALALAKTHRVDVAVLDVRMAEMDGLEVLRRLKEVDPAIEVVMLTAFETADTIREALRLQACDYINKPFDIATMRKAVGTALERRSLASELRTNGEKLSHLQEELKEQKVVDEIATQGEIYASVIHDINGPLTVISALLEGIDEDTGEATRVDGEELDSVKDRLKRITRQVTNCVNISRRYLSLLRQRPGDKVQVWVNQILGELRELLNAYPTGPHRLLVHPLTEDVQVPIHGTDLTQILLNLVLNALQCGRGGHRVDIRGQLVHQPLDLALFEDGPEDRFINRDGFRNSSRLLALSVQDAGPGIAPEVMASMFEPYYTTKGQGGQGTGLGLCIVQRLLREASGGLHAHTKLGQGTVFTVYIPLREPGTAL